MAKVFDAKTGAIITDGLQGRFVCNEARNAARDIAKIKRRSVILIDDDGAWRVTSKGNFYRMKKPFDDDEKRFDAY